MSSYNVGHLITKTIATLQNFATFHHTSPNYTSLHLSTLHFLSFTLHYPLISKDFKWRGHDITEVLSCQFLEVTLKNPENPKDLNVADVFRNGHPTGCKPYSYQPFRRMQYYFFRCVNFSFVSLMNNAITTMPSRRQWYVVILISSNQCYFLFSHFTVAQVSFPVLLPDKWFHEYVLRAAGKAPNRAACKQVSPFPLCSHPVSLRTIQELQFLEFFLRRNV
jgi:hypothetical protein